MTNATLFYLAIIFLVVFGLLLIGILFILIGIRSAIDEKIPNSNVNSRWNGGIFTLHPPIPIDLNTKNSELKRLEKKHKK